MDLNYNTDSRDQWWASDLPQGSPDESLFASAHDYSNLQSLYSPKTMPGDGSISPTMLCSAYADNMYPDPLMFESTNFFDQLMLQLPATETMGLDTPHFQAADESVISTQRLPSTRHCSEHDLVQSSDTESAQSPPSLSASVSSRADSFSMTRAGHRGSKSKTRARKGATSTETPALSPMSARRSSGTRSENKSKARVDHNEIERKYRNRLNTQFGLLINMLGLSDGSEDNGNAEHCARSQSKAEVLAMATRKIRSLESQVKLQKSARLSLMSPSTWISPQ